MVQLHIANTVTDLIQGDVQEHLPLERIPLGGDVLGLGTTSGWDNGELTFLCDDPALAGPGPGDRQAAEAGGPGAGSASADGAPSSSGSPRHQELATRLYKSQPHDGSLLRLEPGAGLQHFPYVCFSDDASALRRPVPRALLAEAAGRPLQQLIAEAIAAMRADGSLEPSPIVGLRLLSRWESLVITVASKLCLGQLRRNEGLARLQRLGGEGESVGASIYDRLPHFRLSAEDPGDPADPIRWLGASRHWECCGFFDAQPESGRVTVPQAGAHLHLHGCSTDLRHGGHLHHEHPGSRLAELQWLVLYPLAAITTLASDLAVAGLGWQAGELTFTVHNQGSLDASDIGVALVINDRWSDHRYLHLPWLAAGAAERVSMSLELPPGPHHLEVIVDPERRILEEEARRANNRAALRLTIAP